jgi:hypothetical protein
MLWLRRKDPASILSQLRSAITGDPKSIDDTISTRGTYETFD